jgi:hypothetical protein
LLFLLLAAAAACAAPEQSLLEQFFGASRLRDTTALHRIATVAFEPREQGIVRTFRIRSVSSERPDGSAAAKHVVVDATVSLPDGRSVQKTLVVTMRRENGQASASWIVTAVSDAPTTPPVPPS